MQKIYTRLRTRVVLLCAFFTLSFTIFNVQPVLAQVPGNCLAYDGVDDLTTLPTGIVQNVTGSFTIEAWVYWRGGTPWQRIFDFGNDANNWVAFVPSSTVVGDVARFAMVSGGNPIQYIDAPGPLALNTWQHLAITMDAGTNDISFFINGTLVNTANGFTYRLSDLGATTINKIGESKFPDPYFNGFIDEFRISNIVRYTASFTPSTTAFTPDPNTVAYYRFEEGSGQTTADASGNFTNAILGNTTAAESNDPAWTNAITLPVRLAFFEGSIQMQGILLKWSASLDAAGTFQIQRSADGITFSSIATIRENSATNGLKQYSFTDSYPLGGRSYYRLKYSETGGPTGYSKAIVINYSALGTVQVFPKPVVNGPISIRFSKPVTGEVAVRIISSSGAVVQSEKVMAANQTEFSIPNRNFIQKGAYVLEIIVNSKRHTETIIVQ